MDTFRHDLRYAFRSLWRDRAFAATTIVTLGLAIGANAAIFTVVHSVLLRPLPYPEPDRLVVTFESFPGAGVERAGTSIPNYFDQRAITEVFESFALYQVSGHRVGRGEAAQGVSGMRVTPSFFEVLQARAARGRLFTEDEGAPGRNRVAVLSHAFAARQPGGVDGVVGREIVVDDRPHMVVGVLPEEFRFLDPNTRLWIPLAFTPEERADENRYSQNHQAIGRLAPGVTLAQAQQRLEAFTARNLERAGPLLPVLKNAGYATRVVSFADDMVRDVRGALHLLWGGVGLVLLIAAVNVTNLSLARATGRAKELATRQALGAGRGRILRLLVTETTVLAVLGGVVGLGLGYWSLDALEWLGLSDLPRASEIRMDWTVVTLTIAAAMVLGMIIGTVPALQTRSVAPGAALREEGRSGTIGRGARLTGRTLVVAQVAFAFVLLIGAGLLLASFQKVLAVDPGFVPTHVLTGRVAPGQVAYPDDDAVLAYTARALERIRALPGVVAAGVTSFLPFSWDDSSSVIIPEGYAASPGESVVSPSQLYITPGYLETLRVPLKRGRFFTESDTASSPRVVIIDERLAQRFWPNEDPVGKRMYFPRSPEDVANPGPDVTRLQVVGVVASVKLKGLVEGSEDARVGAYYIPYAQDPSRNVGFAIRVHPDADPSGVTAAVQRTLAALDPAMQMYDVVPMMERIERSLSPRRAPMLLSLAFGLVALMLASVGIYGVLAYQVIQRTREIGIRLALGSDAAGVVRLVLREGLLLIVIGVAGGVAGAVALRGLIASHLYGVGALDPLVLLAVTGVLATAALAACLGPAVRAARVNPVVALMS
ncbi:MAG TPA: ABC transporter permease [Vicinamibacterales bacterium]|nr:ABC transporter permease [Vicinamibacterales bacterium]